MKYFIAPPLDYRVLTCTPALRIKNSLSIYDAKVINVEINLRKKKSKSSMINKEKKKENKKRKRKKERKKKLNQATCLIKTSKWNSKGQNQTHQQLNESTNRTGKKNYKNLD